MPDRTFGDIPGYPPGSLFESRAHLNETGVHRPLQAGISGNSTDGADSIVLSGGYEDDEDHGDLIIYTGAGGRDPLTGLQTHDQRFDRGNRALAVSSANGLPVRVIRGASHDSPFAPPHGYSYDGLYLVERYWHEPGRSGFRVWRFRLVKIPSLSQSTDSSPERVSEESSFYGIPERQEATVSRVVRDPVLARNLKSLYKFQCQVCRLRLDCPAGPYAEASHIRPLGKPHDGPDIMGNMLCLCPNHHVLFDAGSISIRDDFTVIGKPTRLMVNRKHRVGREYLAYHREHFLTDSG